MYEHQPALNLIAHNSDTLNIMNHNNTSDVSINSWTSSQKCIAIQTVLLIVISNLPVNMNQGEDFPPLQEQLMQKRDGVKDSTEAVLSALLNGMKLVEERLDKVESSSDNEALGAWASHSQEHVRESRLLRRHFHQTWRIASALYVRLSVLETDYFRLREDFELMTKAFRNHIQADDNESQETVPHDIQRIVDRRGRLVDPRDEIDPSSEAAKINNLLRELQPRE